MAFYFLNQVYKYQFNVIRCLMAESGSLTPPTAVLSQPDQAHPHKLLITRCVSVFFPPPPDPTLTLRRLTTHIGVVPHR
jgi:hypothetical protein